MQHSRHQVVEARFLKHEVHVTRPPAVPPQLRQQLAHRPVVRDGVGHGDDSVEPEDTLLVAVYHGAPVGLVAAVVVLHIVLAVAVRLPDVDLDALDRLARGALDGAKHEQRVAVGIGGDGEAVLVRGRVVRVEGAEDGALGAVGRLGVVDGVDEQREADDVGEEDEFLAGQCRDGCSEREGSTCRTSVQICPTWVRNWMPAIHSSKLRRVSRAKSCRCETRRSMTYFSRGSLHCELMRTTFSVMLSMVRSLRTGTDLSPGLGVDMLHLLLLLLLLRLRLLLMLLLLQWLALSRPFF